jgi:hypothetical protein
MMARMAIELDPVPLCDIHFEPMSVHALERPERPGTGSEQWYVHGCDLPGCQRYFAPFGYFGLAQSGKPGDSGGHPRCDVDGLPMYIGKAEPKKLVYFCAQGHPQNRSKEVSR